MRKCASAFFAVCILVLLLASYLVALSYGPRVSRSEIEEKKLWLVNVYVSKHFGISLNKDSFFYMLATKAPVTLLDNGQIMQSRPLLPLLTNLPTSLFEVLFLGPRFSNAPSDTAEYYIAPYIIYVLTNVSTIILSFFLYLWLIANLSGGQGNLTTLIHPLQLPFISGFLLFFNDITKAFVLAAHAQMLNIFIPLYALFCVSYLNNTKVLDLIRISLLSLVAGIGILAYSSFSLCSILVMLSIILRKIKDNDISSNNTVWALFLTITCTAAPSILWYLAVKAETGDFYHHEIHSWRLAIWIFDAKSNGIYWLFDQLASNTFFFIQSMFRYETYIALSWIAILFTVGYPVRSRVQEALKAHWRTMAWSLGIGITFICFFSIVGYRVERLAFSSVTILIFISGFISDIVQRFITDRRRTLLAWCGWILTIGTAIFSAAKDGPYY